MLFTYFYSSNLSRVDYIALELISEVFRKILGVLVYNIRVQAVVNSIYQDFIYGIKLAFVQFRSRMKLENIMFIIRGNHISTSLFPD